MNKIYVDELPKNCQSCPYCYSEISKYDGFYEFCSLRNYEVIKENCPLKPLSDRLAEERKKVIERIRDLAEIYTEPSSKGFDFDTYVLTEENLNNILDKAERGSYE